MNKIITLNDKEIDLLDLDISQIDILDIAAGLSKIPRFNGHTKHFYSVAQHCLNVSYLLEDFNSLLSLEGLLHDASEAYVGDLITPIKHASELNYFKILEKNLSKLILVKYTGRSVYSEMTKLGDTQVLYAEASFLHPALFTRLVSEADDVIRKIVQASTYSYKTYLKYHDFLDALDAESLFLERFSQLYKKC